MSPAERDDPFVIPASELPPPGLETAATAPPPPDEEGPPEGAAVRRAVRLAARPPSRLGAWALRLALALLALVVSVAAYDFAAGLVARSPLLGWLATALAAALAATLIVMLVREALAIRRLKRIDSFHDEARAALAAPDAEPARALVAKLDRFYAARPDLRWERERLEERAPDILDPDALLDLAERSLMTPLDAEARREIEGAARTVAAATALVPLALIDVLDRPLDERPDDPPHRPGLRRAGRRRRLDPAPAHGRHPPPRHRRRRRRRRLRAFRRRRRPRRPPVAPLRRGRHQRSAHRPHRHRRDGGLPPPALPHPPAPARRQHHEPIGHVAHAKSRLKASAPREYTAPHVQDRLPN
jgi:hypothetical protein